MLHSSLHGDRDKPRRPISRAQVRAIVRSLETSVRARQRVHNPSTKPADVAQNTILNDGILREVVGEKGERWADRIFLDCRGDRTFLPVALSELVLKIVSGMEDTVIERLKNQRGGTRWITVTIRGRALAIGRTCTRRHVVDATAFLDILREHFDYLTDHEAITQLRYGILQVARRAIRREEAVQSGVSEGERSRFKPCLLRREWDLVGGLEFSEEEACWALTQAIHNRPTTRSAVEVLLRSLPRLDGNEPGFIKVSASLLAERVLYELMVLHGESGGHYERHRKFMARKDDPGHKMSGDRESRWMINEVKEITRAAAFQLVELRRA